MRSVLILLAVAVSGCAQLPPAADGEVAARPFGVEFIVDLREPGDHATASIRTTRNAGRLRELRFRFDPDRYDRFTADGELSIDDNTVTWRPPRSGGELSYRVVVSQRRGSGGYDARRTEDWALFRGGDMFPPAASRTVAGATSESRLVLRLPDGWSSVTPYRSGDGDHEYPIDNPARDFDRPTGWMLAGKIGVRRGRIGNTRVAIAAPVGEGFRRMDIMAFLNWTLPVLERIFPTIDRRVVIVGAGDPMWRGGLSGPGSLFLHSSRPLISENGTSTLLHELVHVAMGVAGSEHDDWLLEGLAEYYSIRIMGDTGSLSPRRMELTLADLSAWGRDIEDLFRAESSGPRTARAAALLAELDRQLAEAPGGGGLDAVMLEMIDDDRPWDYAALCLAARSVMRGKVAMLHPDNVPGAPDIAECR